MKFELITYPYNHHLVVTAGVINSSDKLVIIYRHINISVTLEFD